MNLLSISTIIAIALGPLIAVQVQKLLERRRNNKNRKLQIFKSLMATRGAVLSATHVEALNRIDLEFSDNKKYKKVIEAWKEYFDNLSDKSTKDEELSIWFTKNIELLANLLYEMGNSLGFSFDKVLIRRNIYSPEGHQQIENENLLIRRGLIGLFKGEIKLKVLVENLVEDETLKKQQEIQDLLIEYYQNEKPLNVKIIDK